MRSQYPFVKDEKEVVNAIRQIQRLRETEDLVDWNNLPQVYVMGRKVARTPSSSADVLATDRVGDINYSTSFLYILVDNSGTPVWRRVALSSW